MTLKKYIWIYGKVHTTRNYLEAFKGIFLKNNATVDKIDVAEVWKITFVLHFAY